MAMILDGEALPEQIGAFLMLLRMKEESAAEIAGFVRAVRARLPAPPRPRARPRLALPTPARRGGRRGICWRRCGSPAPAIAWRCTGSTATRRAASTPARR